MRMNWKAWGVVVVGFFASCKMQKKQATAEANRSSLGTVVRVNATLQGWSPGQPWNKMEPETQSGLGAVVEGKYVLVTAEIVANETFVELVSIDEKKRATAKVKVVDYEADLALLEVADAAQAKEFFEKTQSFELYERGHVGDMLEMVQVEENGETVLTRGTLQRVQVREPFLSDASVLMYRVKASMQSVSSSFMLPVTHDGKLAGLLTSYDSEDQIGGVIGVEEISRFLENSNKESYQGRPDLDMDTADLTDVALRNYLNLQGEQGGVLISEVGVTGAAAKAGLKRGDVLLRVGGQAIDRLGFFDHRDYGSLPWSYLIRNQKAVGDKVTLTIFREKKEQQIELVLGRKPVETYLVPPYSYGKAPNFSIQGGMLFQELTENLLKSFGENWDMEAPLPLLDAYHNPDGYQKQGVRRVVFLSGVIPTPATQGYERLRNVIVTRVNGVPIRDMGDLAKAFETPNAQGFHYVEFENPVVPIYLDSRVVKKVNQQLLQNGLPALQHLGN